MTVNERKARGRSLAPRPNASEEGRPERVPAAGNGNGTSLNNAGSNGNYWSSVPNSDNNNAWNLNFNSSNHNTNNNNRNNGQVVRPVQEFAAAPGSGGPHRSLLADLITAYYDARYHKRGRLYQTRFEMNQEQELVRLRDELLERRYKARPSSCFIIHDPKMREVFAAEFRDRVVHHLFYNYTHELFERTFIADSYSCIEGRGTHYGIDRLRHHLLSCSQNWTKPCYVLKLDVKGYFMSIDRAKLLSRCRELIVKQRARNKSLPALDWGLADYLLESICLLNPVENCRMLGDRSEWDRLPKEKSLFNSKPGCGLPIGNLSSQLFSNIYLGAFDDFMKRELMCRHYGRYVDDAFVVAETKDELYGIVPKVREFLRDELSLELNEGKVRVVDARRGVAFLGAYLKPYRTYLSTRTLRRIRGRMRSLNWKQPASRVQARVNSMLGVLSHCDSYLVRKVLVWQGNLREHGDVSEDCLRFRPDWASGF
ncbi:MAG: RNA-directed DNA polymerase [Kiritimatiellae bacterium]|nr:RNA-directed DNA polymerase [Kiritimatiellia bacterium]